jgi:tetratricopeptide (TPR) repeat protein/transcriptional regulator with XRE-family HTH domain
MGASRDRIGGSGEMVRSRRLAVGLTQEQLAEMSGLSVRAISDIERGVTSRPRSSSAALLDSVLGLAEPEHRTGPADRGDEAEPVVPRQLPQTIRGFTGRENELGLLNNMLDSTGETTPGTVVISAIGGTAGVGKTALAVRWAHQVADRFPDGQLYVNLRGYDPGPPLPAADALAGFLRALGVPGRDIPAEPAERAALYRSVLARRRVLVIVDNASSAEQVRPLLPGAHGCVVVVTSRDTLAGLAARDGATRLELDLLPLPDAVGLLRRLIGARVDDEPAAAEMLATRCARLPLALRVTAELAVGRPAAPLADLADELASQQRLDRLDAGGDPHTAVRTVFSWSVRHLDAEAAQGFRLLGLHPGTGFDTYAVAALLGVAVEHAAQVIGVLAGAHLIQQAGPGRWAMHDLLRDYACELATAADEGHERHAALTRLFDFYLHTAATATKVRHPGDRLSRVPCPATPVPAVSDPAAARAWLVAEEGNLVALAAYAADHGWPGHATGLATSIFRYLELAGHYPEIVIVATSACRAARQAGDRAAEAEALLNLTLADLRQGRYQLAGDRLRQALRLAQAVGYRVGEARALGNLGVVAFHQGRFRQAARSHERALTAYREMGDRFGEGRALNNLGFVELHLGRYRQAAERIRQAESLCGDMGDLAIIIYSRVNLGMIELRQGRIRPAGHRLRGALVLSRQAGNPAGEIYSLINLGLVHLRQGRCQQAEVFLLQALTLCRDIGDRVAEADALNGLGEVLLAAGHADQALAQHRAALSLASRTGDKYEQARAHDGLGCGYLAGGDGEATRCHWVRALSLHARLGTPEAGQIRTRLAAL